MVSLKIRVYPKTNNGKKILQKPNPLIAEKAHFYKGSHLKKNSRNRKFQGSSNLLQSSNNSKIQLQNPLNTTLETKKHSNTLPILV